MGTPPKDGEAAPRASITRSLDVVASLPLLVTLLGTNLATTTGLGHDIFLLGSHEFEPCTVQKRGRGVNRRGKIA